MEAVSIASTSRSTAGSTAKFSAAKACPLIASDARSS